MATVTKQWCSWDSDQGKVNFSYDDVTHNLLSIGWVNNSQLGQQVILTLRPGSTASALSGSINSIPLAAGSLVPLASGEIVQLDANNSFTLTKAVHVGDTSMTVSRQTVQGNIPAGTPVVSVMPTIEIPPVGQQAVEPPPYNVTLGSTGSVNLSNQGISVQSVVSHGITYWFPPADLTCLG